MHGEHLDVEIAKARVVCELTLCFHWDARGWHAISGVLYPDATRSGQKARQVRDYYQRFLLAYENTLCLEGQVEGDECTVPPPCAPASAPAPGPSPNPCPLRICSASNT